MLNIHLQLVPISGMSTVTRLLTLCFHITHKEKITVSHSRTESLTTYLLNIRQASSTELGALVRQLPEISFLCVKLSLNHLPLSNVLVISSLKTSSNIYLTSGNFDIQPPDHLFHSLPFRAFSNILK